MTTKLFSYHFNSEPDVSVDQVEQEWNRVLTCWEHNKFRTPLRGLKKVPGAFLSTDAVVKYVTRNHVPGEQFMIMAYWSEHTQRWDWKVAGFSLPR